MNKKGPLRKLELKERKALKRGLGSIGSDTTMSSVNIRWTYSHSWQKRRLTFCWHLFEPLQTHQYDPHLDLQGQMGHHCQIRQGAAKNSITNHIGVITIPKGSSQSPSPVRRAQGPQQTETDGGERGSWHATRKWMSSGPRKNIPKTYIWSQNEPCGPK